MEYWQLLRKNIGSKQIILPAAAGAIFDDDKVLLVRAAEDDVWFFPGGVQDLNESITRTVEREIEEEISLLLEVDELISVYSDPKWTFTLSNGDIL